MKIIIYVDLQHLKKMTLLLQQNDCEYSVNEAESLVTISKGTTKSINTTINPLPSSDAVRKQKHLF